MWISWERWPSPEPAPKTQKVRLRAVFGGTRSGSRLAASRFNNEGLDGTPRVRMKLEKPMIVAERQKGR
jgi:hypothetical protein